MLKHVFKAPVSRRMPDPVFKGSQRHVLICRVTDVPVGLPKDPNPRAQNTDRLVWKEIRKHLLNEEGTPNTFHLKNKGITLLASDVRRIDGTEDEFEVTFEPESHGIVDGGHTYDLIVRNMDEIRERIAGGEGLDQYVKFEVLTGYDGDIHAEVAGGLNTAIQVQEMSLANLRGAFDWVKEALEDQPYVNRIAFRENERDCAVDVRDLVAIMYLFNVYAFPHDSGEHPLAGYTSKAAVLDHYKRHADEYRTMRAILPDLLTLHDTIAFEARDLHNDAGGRAGKLAFVDSRKSDFEFTFIDRSGKYRLSKAALYPMLAAFRWMVVADPETGLLRWRRDFASVLKLWREVGGRLMKQTQATSDENGRKVHAIGRSGNHWQTLYSTVAMSDMMSSR